MRIALPLLAGAVLAATVAGCETRAEGPSSTTTVNRFYRDIEVCLERTWPDADRKSTLTSYNPKVRVQPLYEMVTYTIGKKSDREFRIVLNETPPNRTRITTFAVGRSLTAAQVNATTRPVIDQCEQMPF